MQPFLYFRSLRFGISLGLHSLVYASLRQKVGGASEMPKNIWHFARLALPLSLCYSNRYTLWVNTCS